MYNPWTEQGEADEKASDALLNYSGAIYTAEEAQKLVGWLGLPEYALLARMFEAVRNESIELMDSGAITVANSEEMVRHSAMRLLIAQVGAMKDLLAEALEERARIEIS